MAQHIVPIVVAAAAVLSASPALAQAQAEPSVDKYLCVYAGKCDGSAPGEEATMAAPEGKGFRIARPAGAKSSAPAATMPARPVAATSASVRRPRPVVAAGPARSDLMIAFALGSDRMTADGTAKARIFAAALLRPELRDRRFRIEGHTDSRGSAAANRLLSERRAEAVAAFLAGQGVDRARLEVRGMGFDAPIPGHAASDPANRRVEAELVS